MTLPYLVGCLVGADVALSQGVCGPKPPESACLEKRSAVHVFQVAVPCIT